MRLNAEITYPGADPDVVFAMMTDRAFQERKCAATGSVVYEVEVHAPEDGSARITTHRTLPTDEIPEFVRRLVGGTVRVVEHGHWQQTDGSGLRRGTIEVAISGSPVMLRGRIGLQWSGDRTVYHVAGELKASVPLIGGRIERAAEPAIRAGIRVEERTGRQWLEGELG